MLEENERLLGVVKNGNIEKENLMEIYERCEKEKRRLSEKNAKLTVSGGCYKMSSHFIASCFKFCYIKHIYSNKHIFSHVSGRELAMDLERLKISKGIVPKKVFIILLTFEFCLFKKED